MEPQRSRAAATAALEHLDWVRALARSLVRDPGLADDIAQETWLAALRKPASGTGISRGWLASVVRNAVRQEHRRGAIRREHEERARVEEEAASPDEVVERVHTQRMVVDAVLALDAPYQRVILLRYFDGLTPRAIAGRLGIPVATVKTRLRRGLAQLRNTLDKRHDGDRGTWMNAVTALAAHTGGEVGAGTLVIGGVVVGTMMKVSAAVLAAAVGVYFLARTPQTDSSRHETAKMVDGDSPLADVTLSVPELLPGVEERAEGTGKRSPVASGSAADVSEVGGASLLRVVLEGSSDDRAREATVTAVAVKVNSGRRSEVRESWSCLGGTSEFDLDPFLARVAQRPGDLLGDELQVVVDHPLHFSETTRLVLSDGVSTDGRTVYEVRARLAEVVYWPELTLTVRDARTREHLRNVELRCAPTAFMGLVQQPGASGPFTVVGRGLRSPIAIRGGRKAGEPEEYAAGMALRPEKGVLLRPAELVQPEENARGIMMYARAPGYAWGRLVLDVSKGAQRELLLERDATLTFRLANVQLERYAALEKLATLFVRKKGEDGSESTVWSRELREWSETEEWRLEGLEPGEYAVLVELGSSWQRKPKELGRETISLPVGEAREALLVLPDPPEPAESASLAGVVSFPNFGGEEEARLEFYGSDYRYGEPDYELRLSELEPIAAELPTWSFRLEDIPAGLYQVRLLPFLKSWMVELPEGGRDDVELVIPELAEVLVETVDARTGQGIPFETVAHRTMEVLPDQVTHGGSGPWNAVAFEGEPGRFRLWAAPGATEITAWDSLSDVDYGRHPQGLELVPGLQSMRLELSPACILRFEFRVDGAPLPHEDRVFVGLSRTIRAVGHEGRVGGMYPYSLLEASAPGLYKISFEGVGVDRFLPIPPRRIEVLEGRTTEVIVELERK